jgi:hypothetical protein
MGTKTRYREPKELAEKIAETIPPSGKIDINSEPAADAVVVHHEPGETVVDEALKPDEATVRLQKQIEDLKKSEELQRTARMMPQRPPSREEKLAAWRAQGMSAEDERTLSERPEMIDYPRLTAIAAHEAAQQHERGTDSHRQATRQIFDEHLARLQAQDTATATAQPAPEFFRPPPTPLPAEPSRASFVSAPVSREVPTGSGSRSNRQIRLTAEEREAAKMAGITEVEYAKQKQKFTEARENEGRYGDRRYS